MPKKKSAKAKLPKTIAGVSIPKHLRNAVEPVLRFAGSPMVSDLLAGALVAGAEHLIEDKGERKATKGEGDARKAGKERNGNTVGLLLAVAAGEIASQIVAAYQAPPEAARKRAKTAESTKPKAPRTARARRNKDKVPSA